MAKVKTQVYEVPYKQIALNKNSIELQDAFVFYNGEYLPLNRFQIATSVKKVHGVTVVDATKEILSLNDFYDNLNNICLKGVFPQTILENIKGVMDFNIHIFVDGKFISINDLAVITKIEKSKNKVKIKDFRPVRSIEDVKSNINSLCVAKENGAEQVKPEGFYVEDKVDRFISTSINTKTETVDDGLRRELKVFEEKKPAKSHYLYVEIDGLRDFVKKSEIYWMDGDQQKSYNDIPEGVDKSKIEFFNGNNQQISTIFTNKEYSFDYIIAKDELDLNKFEKREFKVSNNNYSQITKKLNRTLSTQKFSTTEEKGKSKKTKLINYVTVTNYQYNKNGEYVALNLNGKMHITSINNLETEDGAKVDDLTKFIGKQVKIKNGDQELGLSDTITIEQAKMTYNTVKTYQPVEGEMTDSTCVRLNDGSYINELKTVQPISYKLTPRNQECDAYIVERIVNGNPVYEVVDKEVYAKNKMFKMYSGLNVFRVSQCDINNKNCIAVQTTSKGESVEQCKMVKNFTISKTLTDGSIEKIDIAKQVEKQEAYQAFMQDYKVGNYKISYVYINGKKCELQKNTGRYEYTDSSTREVETKYAQTKKYPVGDSISKTFQNYGKFVGYSFGLAFISAGIPVVGPIVGTAYTLGILAAVPAIPIYHTVVGFVKNVMMSKERLSKENQNKFLKQQAKDANKEIKNLFELLKNKEISNETQFEDAFATHIMDRILTLSQNVRTDKNGEIIKNSSPDLDPLMDKAASLKLFAYIKHFNKSEFAQNNLSFLLSQSDMIGFDLKKGLTINGISILGNDSKITKALKNDQTKVSDWYKIKDAVSEALELMKNSEAKEPVEVKVEDIMIAAAQEEELFKSKIAEIEQLNNRSKELINTIDSNHRKREAKVEDHMLEYDSLKDDVANVYASVEEKVLSSELEVVIEQMNANIEKLEKTINEQKEFNEKLDEIEVVYKECKDLSKKIESQCLSLKKNKETYVDQNEDLKLKVSNAYDTMLGYQFLDHLDISLEELSTYKQDLTVLAEKVDEQIVNSDKELIINRITEYYKIAEQVVDALKSLESSASMTAYTNIILNNKTMISTMLSQAKDPNKSTKEIVAIKDKSKISLMLMDYGLKSLNVLEKNKQNNSSKQDLAKIGSLLGVDGFSKYIRATEDMEIKALRKNLELAKNLYETQLSAYVVEEKTVKQPVAEPVEQPKLEPVKEPIELPIKTSKGEPVAEPAEKPAMKVVKPVAQPVEKVKPVKLFDVKINSEDALVALLKSNPNKKERKSLIEYINKKSGVTISEKDIQLVIERIDKKHLMDPPKSATNNASQLANKNIYYILEYGQQYLTKYAKAIKERTIKNEDNDLGL